MDPKDTQQPDKARDEHDDWQDEDFKDDPDDDLPEPSGDRLREDPATQDDQSALSMDDDVALSALKPPPTRARLTLMVLVVGVIAWYVVGQRDELAYIFGPSQPIELGNALDLSAQPCEDDIPCVPALERIPTGAYVRASGFPINEVPASEKGEFGTKGANKIFFQLQGSALWAEEDGETYVARLEARKGEGSIDDPTVLEPVVVEGRFINLRDDAENRYQQMRKYYTDYFVDVGHFCVDLQPSTLKRLRAERPQGGLIAAITDDATQLSQVASNTDAILQRVQVLESGTGYAVGSAGTILKTSNNGTSWRALASNIEHRTLRDVEFFDDLRGLVVGDQGTILQTEDGGLRFSPVPGLDLAHHFNAIDIHPDGQHILIAGSEGLILQSSNAGQTWTPRPIVKWPDIQDIVRTARGTLIACGEQGTILRSADNGQTWTWMATETVADLEDITFDPLGQTLIAVGEKGVALRSGDDGQTWTNGQVNKIPGIPAEVSRFDRHRHLAIANFRAAALHPDGQQVLFVGDQGAIGVSRDGAQTISLRSDAYATTPYLEHLRDGRGLLKGLLAVSRQQTLGHLNAVAWSDPTSATAVGQFGQCIQTTDAALTWRPCALPLEKFAALVTVKEINRGVPLAAILSSISSQYTQPSLNAVVFLANGHGWIAGDYGLLLHTRDRGQTWSALRPTSRHIFKLQPVAGENLVLFSGNNGLWGYIDARTGAPSYLDQATRDTAPRPRDALHYRGVALLHPLGLPQAPETPDWTIPDAELSPVLVGRDLLIAGYDRAKAEHWLRHQPTVMQPRALAIGARNTPLNPELLALTSTPRTVALAVGDEGRLLRSEDAGRSFIHTPSGTRANLSAVAISADSTTAFVGGEAGTLLRGSLLMRRWRPVALPETLRAATISALLIDPDDAKRLLIVADAAIWLSEDDGAAFREVYTAPSPLRALMIDATTNTVVAVGDGGAIARSTDRGYNWTPLTATTQNLTSVWARGDALLVTTDKGEVLRSEDQGKTWQSALAPLGVALKGVVVDVPSSVGWAIAADGRRLRSLDAGKTWQVLSALTGTALHGLSYSAQTGEIWLLGADQTIFHGAFPTEGTPHDDRWSLRPVVHVWRWTSEWGRFAAELPTDLFDVTFTTHQQDAFAVGSEGVILYSADSGQRWVNRRAGEFGEAFRAVEFDKAGRIGLAVGLGGRLLWTENRGESWFSEPSPPDTGADFFAVTATGKPSSTYFTVFGNLGAIARLRAPSVNKAPRLSLIPNLEAIRGAAVLADGQTLLTVGGDTPPTQDLCSPGYVIVSGDTPGDYWHRHWLKVLVFIGIVLFGLFTAVNFVFQVRRFQRAARAKNAAQQL